MRAFLIVLVFTLVAVMSVSGLRASGESDVLFISSVREEIGDETTVTLGVVELADPLPPLGRSTSGTTIHLSLPRSATG